MQKRIKKIVAYVPAWGFFWLGHWTSLVINMGVEWIFPVYSTLMSWSLFFNDWGGLDVWVDSQPEDE